MRARVKCTQKPQGVCKHALLNPYPTSVRALSLVLQAPNEEQIYIYCFLDPQIISLSRIYTVPVGTSVYLIRDRAFGRTLFTRCIFHDALRRINIDICGLPDGKLANGLKNYLLRSNGEVSVVWNHFALWAGCNVGNGQLEKVIK